MSQKLLVELEVISNATKEISSIGREFNTFQNKIVALGRAISGVFVGGAIASGIKNTLSDLRKESQEYTALQNQMREALGYTSIALMTQVEEMENKLLIDHMETTKVQQQLALYSQNEEELKRLTAATINYAVAKHKDLGFATEFITKAINSEKGTLRGFPGVLDGAAGSSERLASITDTLNKRFDGQAFAVAASKDWIDKLKVAFDQFRHTASTGLFGRKDEKEALRYQQASEFVEKYATASEWFRKVNEEAYKEDLKLMQDYEGRKNSEKLKALNDANMQAAGASMKNINLTPGYANEKEYQKEKIKEAEDAKKKQIATDHWLNTQGLEVMRKDMDEEAKAKYDIEADVDRKLRELWKKEKDDDYEATKNSIQDKERAWKDAMRQRWEYEKQLEAMKPQLYANSAQNALSALQKIGQASKANARTMKNLERGQAIAAGALAAIRALQNPAPFLKWADFTAVGLATGAQLAIIDRAGFWKGSGGTSDGPAWVNERGRELIDLPRGSVVHTASETKNLTTNNSGGNTVNVHIHGQNGDIIDTFNASMRRGTGNVDQFFDFIIQGIKQRG
ncbi:MAG: hypothetical protein PHN88_14825 [Ignavibacteria bacterium]|nr:hypothetical protein [Ignavibacteria bacterium]